MSELQQVTLRFLMQLFKEISDEQSCNRMNAYNISVCVALHIFRSKTEQGYEWERHGSYYDTMIHMIEWHENIFDINQQN